VPPESAIYEPIPGRLNAIVNDRREVPDGGMLLRQAGDGTAYYLLRHRIPQPFQRVERLLPASWQFVLRHGR